MDLNYDAIIFDLGGVILNINYHKTAETFKKMGLTNFDEVYSQASQIGLFSQLETGKISPETFYDSIRELSNLPLDNVDIEAAWNAMLLDLPKARVDYLKEIGSQIPIFLLSNTNSIHLKAFRSIIADSFGADRLLETLFVETYYSHEVQMRKPNSDIFEYVLNKNRLSPERTLFIDDSIQHIKGANAVGLKTHHLVKEDITELFR